MAQVVAPHRSVGQRLADRYRIDRLICRGGMADVLEAEDERLRRRVAVKLFRADPVADRSRFDSEVSVLAALDHPNLVRVFDAGEHDGDAFVVLELVEGPTLADRLADGPVGSVEVARLGTAMADALGYVHEQGVVHRDVTPSNILCDPEGRPRLADFGIARVLDATRRTSTSVTVGTAAYMAPEQVQGRDVTGAADVYSLGLVLLELLTARRAFEGSVHEVAMARLTQPPDTSEAPEPWRELLTAMTALAPEDRPTPTEVRTRLDDLAHAAPDGSTGTVVVAAETGAAAAVSGEAQTQVLEGTASRTQVLPVTLTPSPAPEVAPSASAGVVGAVAAALWARRALVAVIAGMAALILVGVAAAGSNDLDVPPPSTVPASDTPTTLAPTTSAPTTTEAPAEEGSGKGKGHGKRGDDG